MSPDTRGERGAPELLGPGFQAVGALEAAGPRLGGAREGGVRGRLCRSGSRWDRRFAGSELVIKVL